MTHRELEKHILMVIKSQLHQEMPPTLSHNRFSQASLLKHLLQSNSSISFKGLNLFDCLRGNLWDKVVPIKDQGLEQPSWRDVRAELGFSKKDFPRYYYQESIC
ncbi:hypothetical protein G4B88_007632 [Cannabis sativa]|uniref:Uncharacterized protein n=1 Tax=Cannabis sativa TaxID=3483 RepID=A0A7J6HE69_CANSA|nr:hypothetical protein G4B88_007632 [Cannabis sativa]